MWILIGVLVLSNQSSVPINTQFNTSSACEIAKAELINGMPGKVFLKCVDKG